jgi:transcriptional regulator GlxA family with amidase domain
LDKRLDRAVDLLRDPRHAGKKIVDIAFATGFTDVSHFNRSFRRRFGDTPSGVRTTRRKDD